MGSSWQLGERGKVASVEREHARAGGANEVRHGRPAESARCYPLFVVISKDDVMPKFSFFGIFTGNFSDIAF